MTRTQLMRRMYGIDSQSPGLVGPQTASPQVEPRLTMLCSSGHIQEKGPIKPALGAAECAQQLTQSDGRAIDRLEGPEQKHFGGSR